MKFVFDECFLKADVRIEPICSVKGAGPDNAKFADFQVVQAKLWRDANAPVDRLERCVAVKQIEADTKGLIEKSLFATAKETGTAGICRADIARRRNAASVKKSLRGGSQIQKSLLAEPFGPDRFIALKLVAIKRIVPTRLDVKIFALRGVPPIFWLLKLPAVRNFVVDVGNWRQNFRRGVEDV